MDTYLILAFLLGVVTTAGFFEVRQIVLAKRKGQANA